MPAGSFKLTVACLRCTAHVVQRPHSRSGSISGDRPPRPKRQGSFRCAWWRHAARGSPCMHSKSSRCQHAVGAPNVCECRVSAWLVMQSITSPLLPGPLSVNLRPHGAAMPLHTRPCLARRAAAAAAHAATRGQRPSARVALHVSLTCASQCLWLHPPPVRLPACPHACLPALSAGDRACTATFATCSIAAQLALAPMHA